MVIDEKVLIALESDELEDNGSVTKKIKLDVDNSNEKTPIIDFSDNLRIEYDENCAECKQEYKDPMPKDLVMYLHALSYKVSC